MGRNIVQYWGANDFQAAKSLADFLGFELINTQNTSDLAGFDRLVVVGGQGINPVFVNMVSGGGFRNIEPSDVGYVFIQYKKSSFLFWTNEVWLVAGWSSTETMSSATDILTFGLTPLTRRYLIGTTPPLPPQPPTQPSPETDKIKIVIDSLTAQAPFLIGGVALGVGSMFIENDKLKKIMLLGGLGVAGYGGIKFFQDIHDKGVI